MIRNIKKDGDCSVLLTDALINYYWLGFIFADGHIDKSVRLKVTLSSLDRLHLDKLRIYLSKSKFTEDKVKYTSISVMDSKVIRLLCEKYNIHSDKTKNPCDISSILNNNLTSFLIGFIDGDGCIFNQTNRIDTLCTVKCHKSWIDNLNYLTNHLYNENKAYLTNAGYARFSISHKILKELKDFSIKNKLPILERKWNKIKM